MKHFLWIIASLCLWNACTQPTVEQKSALPEDGTSAFFDASLKPFYHGVASGDPRPSSVVLWTRVTPEFNEAVAVTWKIATDSAMQQVVQSGEFTTDSTRDFTVNLTVEALKSNTYYYYQFYWGDAASMVGRTKTTPSGDAEQLRLGVVSCSNYEAGYFNAYAHLAKKELDGILHLGDYIYEYQPGGYGDPSIDRKHLPKKEIITLADYRTRYAQYRLDPDLRKVHQMHPFITIWDDHEITNNSHRTGAQNHQPEEGDYEERKAAASQAYFEWLPISDNPEQDIVREISFGNLAELWMLDERLVGRTEQASDMEQADFLSPERTMLGKAQYNWLLDNLSTSKATWKILGNQVIFSPLDVSAIYRGSQRNLDAWDGYPAERDSIVHFITENNIDNVVILTGDTHSSWAFEVPKDADTYQKGTGAAVEFGTTSITSSNSDERVGVDTVMLGEQKAQALNPHLDYINLRDHGYLLLTLTSEQAVAEWYYVDKLNEPSSEEALGMRYTVKVGETTLVRDNAL